MRNSIHEITLDFFNPIMQVSITVKRNDTARKLHISLYDNGKPYTLTNDMYAMLLITKANNTYILNDCQIDFNRNIIIYDFTEQTTSVTGISNCEVRLYSTSGELLTSPRFIMFVNDIVYSTEQISSENEFTTLDRLITESNNLDIDCVKSDGISTVTVTKKDGSTSTVNILDGIVDDIVLTYRVVGNKVNLNGVDQTYTQIYNACVTGDKAIYLRDGNNNNEIYHLHKVEGSGIGNAIVFSATFGNENRQISIYNRGPAGIEIMITLPAIFLTSADVDQTYDATSTKAQSGVAFAGIIDNMVSQELYIAEKRAILSAIQTSNQNISDLSDEISNKVDKINGKQLSTNDYTTAEKNKLAELNIDQTYSPTSANAQSGVAFAEGLKTRVPTNWTKILDDVTLASEVGYILHNKLSGDKRTNNLSQYSEFIIDIMIPENATKGMFKIYVNGINNGTIGGHIIANSLPTYAPTISNEYLSSKSWITLHITRFDGMFIVSQMVSAAGGVPINSTPTVRSTTVLDLTTIYGFAVTASGRTFPVGTTFKFYGR